jgi:hypothetical protein
LSAGLDGSVSISGFALENFTIYSLEMKMSFFEKYDLPYPYGHFV